MARVLVIEDEYLLLEQIISMLRMAGFEVIGAGNGMQGAELAKTQVPDLIVCDINMPHMNGYDVLSEVRQTPETMLVPFVFLTARADSDSMRQGMALGADDYVTKPFRYGELVRAVQTRLDRRAAFTQSHADELERTKSILRYVVAHELRTPLVSINLVKEIVSRQRNLLERDELNDLMDTFASSTDRLSHLVEQMVYLTQIETGAMNDKVSGDYARTLQVWQLVVGATDLARRFAHRHPQLQIDVHEQDRDAALKGDIWSLKHAVAEVIANALDFSPEAASVAIAYYQTDDCVEICITDQGSGMTPEQQKRALRDFEQINRDVQEQQGMGLGLYLARRIVAAHHGEFHLNSTLGHGTQVIIRLPLYT